MQLFNTRQIYFSQIVTCIAKLFHLSYIRFLINTVHDLGKKRRGNENFIYVMEMYELGVHVFLKPEKCLKDLVIMSLQPSIIALWIE